MGLGQLFRQLKEALRDPTREQLVRPAYAKLA